MLYCCALKEFLILQVYLLPSVFEIIAHPGLIPFRLQSGVRAVFEDDISFVTPLPFQPLNIPKHQSNSLESREKLA